MQKSKINSVGCDSPISSQDQLSDISDFARKCTENGFTHAILLGMGGSSMAPEVFASIGKSFGLTNGGLQLVVLDTTDPRQILNVARTINPLNTLFIVASKSGSTTEVDALFSYFWHLTYSLVGENCGEHFIAITDPGTSLEKLGREKNFARIFLARPERRRSDILH